MVSAAASWMDTFKMSMREIKKKYTKSEMLLMAWDSRQKSYAMKQLYSSSKTTKQSGVAKDSVTTTPARHNVRETKDGYELPDNVNNGVSIPKKFFNNSGEIDLSHASGPEAVKYLQALGINIAFRI